MVGFIESHMNARGRPAATAKGGTPQQQSWTSGVGTFSLYLYIYIYIYIHRLHKLITIYMEGFYEYFALHLLPLVQILQ